MKDLERARQILEQDSCTCVLCRGEELIRCRQRGVAPLLELLDRRGQLRGFSAADRVVGKAAAMLYVQLNVTAVYAEVISQPALEMLRQYGIRAEYLQCVEAIRNRTDTGNCPMETAVLALNDPALAEVAIREKLLQLKKE